MDEKISEEDRLKMNLLSEREQRFAAERMNIEMANKALQSAHGQLQVEKMGLSSAIQAKYTLAPTDEVDLKTGVITRDPKATRAAAPPPALSVVPPPTDEIRPGDVKVQATGTADPPAASA